MKTTQHQLDLFTAAYIEAVRFTETGDTGQPASTADIEPWAQEEASEDCIAFLAALTPRTWAYITADTERLTQAGHDFWLERNGHGAGFWDRPEIWPEYIITEMESLLGFRQQFDTVDEGADYFGSVRYEYFVNLDERGEFSADVRDNCGHTIADIDADTIADGFMRHSRDLDGLAEHLTELGILPEGATLTAGN